jgi:hypothetical protein
MTKARSVLSIMLATMGLVALVVSLVGTASARQEAPETGPLVLCSWSLADVGGSDDGSFVHGPDDDPATVPSGTGAPCTYDAETGRITQPAGVTGMAQVRPLPGGEARRVASHVAVAQPVGGAVADAVTVTVTGPDGEAHAEADGTILACGAEPIGALTWAGTGEDAAGAIAAAAITNPDGRGLFDRCRQGDVDIYEAVWEIDATAPCGAYTVTVEVVSADGTTAFGHEIDIVCFWWLEIDFNYLGWELRPGTSTTIEGDLDRETTDAPTVVNLGNAPLEVGIELSALAHADSDATLDDFSASLGGAGTVIEPDSVTWLDAGNGPLCALDDAPLSVGLAIPVDAPTGSYDGSFTVWARAGIEGPCAGAADGSDAEDSAEGSTGSEVADEADGADGEEG